MDWQHFFNMFEPGGNQGVRQREAGISATKADIDYRKAETQRLSAEAQDRHRDATFRLHEALMSQGYKPSVGGMVQEDYSDLPGLSAPAQTAGSNLPTDVPLPGTSIPPTQGQSYLRPLDKSREFTMKDHTGEDVTYERPSEMEIVRNLVRQQTPARQAAAEQAGNVAQSTERGRQAGLNQSREQYGVALPEGSGVAEGKKFLPEEVGGVASGLTQATELPNKLRQAKLMRASQSLGSVTTPGAYKILYNGLPDDIKESFDPPDQFDPLKSPTRARMVAMPPEQQQKASMLLNIPPEEWDSKVDAAYPPTGPTAAQNKGARILVKGYLRRGEFDKADAMIKDGLDQQGKTISAVATAKATAPIKISVNAAEAANRLQSQQNATGLGADDYVRAGQEYGMTGIMPPLGRDSVTRGKIMKASNDWARDNGFTPRDIVTMHAAFKGDSKSLEAMVKSRDQISQFEQTATKNLDLFLNAASKIPDTGVPWLNKPLRELNQNVVGSANIAAVNVARQVANNEIAKVTSGGALSSVLSDSARHEVEAYNPANATFKQTLAVAKILKADMANRKASLDAAVGEIKERIGGGPSTNSGGMVNMRAPDGSVKPVPADQVDHYLKLGAKRVQ